MQSQPGTRFSRSG